VCVCCIIARRRFALGDTWCSFEVVVRLGKEERFIIESFGNDLKPYAKL